jgi:hypothetical protein
MGYAPDMPFPAEDLALLTGAEEIEIETRAAPDADIHRTIVWVVTDGSDAFIRSVNGHPARWYREATGNPIVAVRVAGRQLSARAVPAPDETSIERTSRALATKYRGMVGLREMLLPDVLDTTLRLEPD